MQWRLKAYILTYTVTVIITVNERFKRADVDISLLQLHLIMSLTLSHFIFSCKSTCDANVRYIVLDVVVVVGATSYN